MTKVLIVDDSKLIHKITKNVLVNREVEIESAFNGNEAIEVFKSFKPDLVLLDIVMPEKDGIETLKDLLIINPDVRAIMVSSMGTKDKVAEALQLGAIDFLQKPFDEEALLSHFDKLEG